METALSSNNYPFLNGGGELGTLTRQYDWATSPLGRPDQWPASLRVTLSMLLNANFPMLLWWGDDLVQFYNDAYRPILGVNGKHPTALGQRAADCWPALWPRLKPIIDQVLRGEEATVNDDQLIPNDLYGPTEERHWIHSYSPVRDESGQPTGVLVICSETTRAVLNQQKLEAIEARYQLLFEQAPVGISTLRGEELIIDTANAKILEILDKPTSIIGRPWLEVLPELVGQPAETIIKNVYQSGLPYTATEFSAQLKKNDQLVQGYYTFSYLPMVETGVTTGVVQIAVEVTDQVLARQQVAESEAKLRSLIEQAPVAMGLFVGQDMIIELANTLMISYFGKGRSILGKPIREVLTAPGDQSAVQLLEQVFTTGEAFEAKGAPADLIIDGVQGTYYFDFSLKPIVNATGEVYAILETAVEVTAQVMARLKRDEAESGLRVAVELAQLGTWSIDLATNGLTFSDRLIDWFGYDPSRQDYRVVIPILDIADQERVTSAIAWALNPESGGVYDEVYSVTHPQSGQKRIIHARGKTIFDAAGKAIRLNGTAQDITLQRELQLTLENEVMLRTQELAASNEEYVAINEELEAANHLLLRSNDNLQQFAYVASHDLQEPLRKIQQFADLLKAQYTLSTSEQHTYLERMQSAASRMSRLIRDLLNFSRISTQIETTVPVSLREVVNDVLGQLDLRLQETGAKVDVGDLPIMQGDRSQVEQLVTNLLSNALKFHQPDRTPIVRIRATRVTSEALPPWVQPARQSQTYYRMDVTDNGIGFEEKYIDRIFQVFQRLHSRNEFAGTGIGLAICKRVAENHGGDITASSQLGVGSTFSVFFPI